MKICKKGTILMPKGTKGLIDIKKSFNLKPITPKIVKIKR